MWEVNDIYHFVLWMHFTDPKNFPNEPDLKDVLDRYVYFLIKIHFLILILRVAMPCIELPRPRSLSDSPRNTKTQTKENSSITTTEILSLTSYLSSGEQYLSPDQKNIVPDQELETPDNF